MNTKELIGKNICFLMTLYGKSRRDVAEDLDIRYTTLTDWIKGNSYPRVEALEKLGAYFRVNLQDFFVDISSGYGSFSHLSQYAEQYGVYLSNRRDSMKDADVKITEAGAEDTNRPAHRTLEERASLFGGQLGPYSEMDLGKAVGRELW